MTIHIFNPEHDLALAADQERFTAPHAGRQLACDVGFLPALWSKEGDVVVVDDIDAAESAYHKLKHVVKHDIEFATFIQLNGIISHEMAEGKRIRIAPWGWNKALCFKLMSAGVPESLLPSSEELKQIRIISNRRLTTSVLKSLRSGIGEDTCGESAYYDDYDKACDAIKALGKCVIKAPWSSSGRGVRYIVDNEELRHLQNTHNWMQNTIRQQGGVMIEPLYNKVKDFGMEFTAHEDGSVSYDGLSLFSTLNGAYTGNLLAPEEEKRELISRFIPLELIDEIANRICKTLKLSPYVGPFGVDMMVVARSSDVSESNNSYEGFLLHPCVEINVRRTMGHVALAISPAEKYRHLSMAITYNGRNYHYAIKQDLTRQ